MPSSDYAKALDATAELCRRAVEYLLANAPEDGIADAYAAVMKRYGEVAAQVALDRYVELSEDVEGADGFEPKAYAGAVSAASSAADLKANAAAALPGIAAKRVLQCADDTLLSNATLDPRKPRYMLLAKPTACGFCRLQASNGYTYATYARANYKRHANCTCMPSVVFTAEQAAEGEAVAAKYAEQYVSFFDDEEGDDAEWEWQNMSAEERKKYVRHGRTAHDVFIRGKLAAYMDAGRSHN